MYQLDREAYVTIDNGYNLYNEVYKHLDGIKTITKSGAGFEYATFIVNVVELIAIIVSMPVIQDAFNNGHIIVMIGGVKFNDTVCRIIKEIKKDPKLLEAAKTACIDETISLEGKAKAVQSFREKLQLVIESMEADQ